MREAEIIARVARFPRFHPQLQLGIEDDAAILLPEPGVYWVWAVDTLVENTHFLRQMPAAEIGWKSLAVNLSDLAAMNAEPVAALLSLALPADLPSDWLGQYLDGLEQACRVYRVDLAGGDTVRQSSEINLSLSLLGRSHQPVRRRGAKSGDLLVLTGRCGGSAAGLYAFQNGLAHPDLLRAHLHPEPCFAEAAALSDYCLGAGLRLAMLDTSDSLSRSLILLSELNQLGCEVDFESIPQFPGLAELGSPEQVFEWVVQGGEDYQLLAAVAPAAESWLKQDGRFQMIGQLKDQPGCWLSVQQQRYNLHQLPGFEHF